LEGRCVPTLRLEKADQETFRFRIGHGGQCRERRARLRRQSKVLLRLRCGPAASALMRTLNR
jgi:hypothetical protein